MIEALDEWIIDSEFVKNPPDYDLLPDPYTITYIDGDTLHKAIELAKKDKSITIDSTHADYVELLINLLESMI
jgi:hypothetical protein|tara:strand:- start:2475 stop:2693 length:219 start_codon:yes stop_codon:yes gene_type:complete